MPESMSNQNRYEEVKKDIIGMTFLEYERSGLDKTADLIDIEIEPDNVSKISWKIDRVYLEIARDLAIKAVRKAEEPRRSDSKDIQTVNLESDGFKTGKVDLNTRTVKVAVPGIGNDHNISVASLLFQIPGPGGMASSPAPAEKA